MLQANTSAVALDVGGDAEEDGEIDIGPRCPAAPAPDGGGDVDVCNGGGGDRERPPFVCWSYTAAAAAMDRSVR
jgi:hypothetical protein